MDKLIRTSLTNIVYGDFNGVPNQELFRSPIENDLIEYLNRERKCVQLVDAEEKDDLYTLQGVKLVGYYRMYYRNSWSGRWILDNGNEPDRLECVGVQNIIDYICEKYPKGINYAAEYEIENEFKQVAEHRFLLKPYGNEYYRVLIDTTYHNDDYPIRIYVYR